jgi:hypothetical protein
MTPHKKYLAVRLSDYLPRKPPSRFLRLVDSAWKTRLGAWALKNLLSPLPIPVEVDLRYGEEAETWLVEFHDGTAVREVGLNDRGQPVCSGNMSGIFAGEVGIEDLADVSYEEVPAEVFKSTWERAHTTPHPDQ